MLNRIFQLLDHDLSTGPLQFEARQNYAYEIIDIGCTGLGTDDQLDVVIGTNKMAVLPMLENDLAVSPLIYGGVSNRPFYSQLKKQFGAFIPNMIIGEGEMLSISTVNPTGRVQVLMKEYMGDSLPKNSDKGGSLSGVKTYATKGVSIISVGAGSTLVARLDVSSIPAGYTRFPFEQYVLPNEVISILGFAINLGSGSGAGITVDGVRLWRLNQSILAPNEAFLPIDIFRPVGVIADQRMTLFEVPVTYDINENGIFEVQISNSGVGPEDAMVYIAPIINIVTK